MDISEHAKCCVKISTNIDTDSVIHPNLNFLKLECQVVYCDIALATKVENYQYPTLLPLIISRLMRCLTIACVLTSLTSSTNFKHFLHFHFMIP